MNDERKLTFGGRRAMNIIGTPNTKLYREEKYPEAGTHALREPDKKILNHIDGKSSVRQIISEAGVDFETGLHSIAWLMQTGFVYSSEVIERILQEHSDKLAFFAEIFADAEHDEEFWEKVISDIVSDNPELEDKAPGLSWEGLSPTVKPPPPSPAQLKDYFINVMVALYDKAEEILGPDAVLAKRILLDSRRPSG
ncbi:hypothetical protein GF359_00860 [candidate division WOR-3 bacterium]|uniref:Uncharacterized protein n=1 Tax=candidate division WOR-3 bacterium TaxID=2052148 RepID=A0A9D5K7J9_UNCW3|nr:hypothetical protein [candidate division WOR-3 bacterium]MBD3363743.1 hypothetical protein [candidate division WOR-3 bacterium]